MALVAAAAFFMAVLFILFRVFEQRRVALLPAIVVNYYVAFLCGAVVAPPWSAGSLHQLWIPSLVLGLLFISIFYFTGLSSQRAGVAATAVASKMSLVLTVLFAVFLYGDSPGPLGWLGIALALVGVVLSSAVKNRSAVRGEWILPGILFIGNAAIDITINWVQRVHLTPATEAVFPTLVFGIAAVLGTLWVLRGRERNMLLQPITLTGGGILGIMNFAALYFVVQALTYSGMESSSVYPVINIGVILLGTFLSILLFQERPRRIQYAGIALSVVALLLILAAQ